MCKTIIHPYLSQSVYLSIHSFNPRHGKRLVNFLWSTEVQKLKAVVHNGQNSRNLLLLFLSTFCNQSVMDLLILKHLRRIVYELLLSFFALQDAPVKLCDFGFAKIDQGDLTTPQFTPYYVAPQVQKGQKIMSAFFSLINW